MAYLHYGADVRISVDEVAAQRIVEMVGAHASRGGWVTTTDTDGQEWSLLITVGIPIWIEPGT